MARVGCPYAQGRQCPGHVIRVEVTGTLHWLFSPSDEWNFGWYPQAHYSLSCSEKIDHAQRKYHWHELPEELRRVVGVNLKLRA